LVRSLPPPLDRQIGILKQVSPQETQEKAILQGFAFLCDSGVNKKTQELEANMSIFGLIEYPDASPEVRAIYDDIMTTRKTDWINNFWKAIAHDPATLKRTWEDIKQIMGPGALDPVTKELIYVAVSVTNQCHYCIASHTASAQKKGMTDAMFKELMAIVGMANETNKMVTGYQVEIDDQFHK
jgi:AhpD family alkylhydroperoxidase